MFAIARNLRLIAGLVVLAAIQPAAAQATSPVAPQTVSARSDCPVEPHRKAINPDVIECHARFAPLPDLPPEINTGNEQHLEALRSMGDDLLRQLDRPEACAENAKVRVNQACAILVYVIDPQFRQARLPWTYIVKIYRTTHPPKDRLRDTMVRTVQSNNSEEVFGPGSIDGEVWQLLAKQRATTRCKLGVREFLRDTRSPSASQRGNPDRCKQTGEDVRYRPILLIGRGEAELVLNPASIKRNFGPQ